MKRIRYWVRDFFGFSQQEINGFLVLMSLMAMLILSQPLYQRFVFSDDDTHEDKFLDSLVVNWDANPSLSKKEGETNFFPFNPNKVSKHTLEQMGLSPSLAQRTLNYRSHGGRFRTPADLLKIYGMDSLWYARAAPFIKLPSMGTKIKRKKIQWSNKTPAAYPGAAFDLNTADSVQLQSIVGIGPVLARRIIKYKNILGGFVYKDQLHEVYGLDSSVVARLVQRSFILPSFIPNKIDINTNAKSLSTHPYISRNLARRIAAYRFQHGNFKTLDDLLNLHAVDSATWTRLNPYLKIKS